MSICKRSFLVLLSSLIIFLSVESAYYESVEAAEWVSSIAGAIGFGGPAAALIVGGVIVVGGVGIAVEKWLSMTPSERDEFVNGIKNGFNSFVAKQEAVIAKEQDQSLSDQQAADIGVANARDVVNNFSHNALEATRTTGKNLWTKSVDYWKKFSNTVMNDLLDNGLSVNQDVIPSPDNPVGIPSFNGSEWVISNVQTNSNSKFFQLNGAYYIQQGEFFGSVYDYPRSSGSYYQYRFPVCVRVNKYDAQGNKTGERIHLRVLKTRYDLNNVFMGNNYSSWAGITYRDREYFTQEDLDQITFPLITVNNDPSVDDPLLDVNAYLEQNYTNVLAVGRQVIEQYMLDMYNLILSNKLGQILQELRDQANAQGAVSAYNSDAIPVKKQGITTKEGEAVGRVGWDIPSDQVLDGVMEGVLPFPDVYPEIGVLEVPWPSVSDQPTAGEIEWPIDADVDDPSYPEDDDPTADPDDPDTGDILEDQGGNFYPAAMDLTELFPFCIPFDIIYLVNKLYVTPVAPVINIDYVYPQALRPYLGNSYTLTIDFNDFVTLRNIIRVFLLLMFIVGLMKMTRDLIRG